MRNPCSIPNDNEKILINKINLFLSNKEIDAVTGIRRSGREHLVDLAKDIAEHNGLDCSMYPDSSGKDIVFFYNWIDMENEMDTLYSSGTCSDIVFGQDLCHQVPAIVRYRP